METDDFYEDGELDCMDSQYGEPVFDWKKIVLLLAVSAILYFSISWVGGLDERYYLKGAELLENGRNEEAAEFFQKSVKMGGEEAAYVLGRCYLEGVGVQKDTLEGMRFIMKSVDDAFADAQYFLAQCYYYGLYVDADKEKTIRYLTYASRQNHPDAQCALGVCYMNGDGVKQDLKKAYDLIMRAKKNGSVNAEACLEVLESME